MDIVDIDLGAGSVRRLAGLTDALVFTADKRPARDVKLWQVTIPASAPYPFRMFARHPRSDKRDITGVQFTDGSALLLVADYDAGYSTLTEGDGITVQWHAWEPSPAPVVDDPNDPIPASLRALMRELVDEGAVPPGAGIHRLSILPGDAPPPPDEVTRA